MMSLARARPGRLAGRPLGQAEMKLAVSGRAGLTISPGRFAAQHTGRVKQRCEELQRG